MTYSKLMRFLFVVLTAILASSAKAQGGSCKDPWINQAYNELYHRAPNGSGSSGECNTTMYGGGHWTTLDDLEHKVIAVRGRPTAVQAPVSAPASSASILKPSALHLDRNANIVDASGSVVVKAGSFALMNPSGAIVNPASIVAQGGGNIVAQGGGNIVAQGGGNIVAQGGGNMRSLESVGGKPIYRLQ